MSDIESSGKSLPPELMDAAIELWSQDGPTHWLPVSGRSMLPGLREGDYVLIHRLTQGYEAGAILTVKHTGGIISHRLLAIHQQADGKTLYITKGDNSPYLDPPTKEEDVIGQVTTIRRGNRALSFETDTWIRVNRRIAYLMHAYSRIYPPHENDQIEPSRSIPSLFRIACYHILQLGFRMLFQAFIFLYGSWKRV